MVILTDIILRTLYPVCYTNMFLEYPDKCKNYWSLSIIIQYLITARCLRADCE